MKILLSVFICIFIISNGLFPLSVKADKLDAGEKERRIGHLFDRYMAESFVILRDEELYEKIGEIVEKIAGAAGNVRLRIINDQLPVASSFPGYVYVSTGMLDILESDDELAFVIAHAITHTIENHQHELYLAAMLKEKREKLFGQVMPLLVFSGVGGAAIAGVSGSAMGSILFVESGLFTVTTFSNLSTADTYENNYHNRIVPYVNLPDRKASLSAMVYLSEIFMGHEKEKELKADILAISYLAVAGYDPNAAMLVLKKLLNLRNDSITHRHIYHLLLARPGLEKRIENASTVLEKYN